MSLALRLSLFYGDFFLSAGILSPFWPVWLTSRGLSPGEIGVLLAIGQWAKVAATLVTGGVADRSGDPRRVMLVLGCGPKVRQPRRCSSTAARGR